MVAIPLAELLLLVTCIVAGSFIAGALVSVKLSAKEKVTNKHKLLDKQEEFLDEVIRRQEAGESLSEWEEYRNQREEKLKREIDKLSSAPLKEIIKSNVRRELGTYANHANLEEELRDDLQDPEEIRDEYQKIREAEKELWEELEISGELV